MTRPNALSSSFSSFVCLLTLAPAQGTQPAEADKVWLRDGKVLIGTVTERKASYVDVLVGGKTQRIARDKIDKITDAKDHVRWVDATETKSARYTITSNAKKVDVEALAKKLELFYDWFFATYGKDFKLHAAKRLGATLADRREEFIALGKSVAGRAMQGFYSQGDETLYVCRESVDGADDPDHTLFHEAGHQILHLCANMGSSATERHWVHEAMACTFEGLRIENGKLVAGLSEQRIRNLQIRIARGDALRPLASLDRLRKEQYLAPEYDQGYALATLFLTAEGGKWRKPFLAYFQDIAYTRVREDTFEKLFGRKIESFEKEYREFVVGLKLGAQR